jgi:hypothetical protein
VAVAREALEAQARLAEFLPGMRCSQVSAGAAETLILDFGDLREVVTGDLTGSIILLIECPWRIDSPDGGLIGWEDEEDDILVAATAVIDATVESVEVRRPGFDLILRFSNEHSLRIFPDCRAYYDDALAGGVVPWQIGGEAIPPAVITGGLIPS